ncbi:nitroreductase family protein [Pigmentiphaga soli]|uniref:Nitroreductase family protein n=1 Tax=Pigmentiphaga soli TaxID=1007095 RepID=A0ABP8HN67_9BURK
MSHPSSRTPTHPIHPQFLSRWSPRAFTGEAIEESTLLGFIEAARWAPSASNLQPWRFIYARRGTPSWERFMGLLLEANQVWAANASAIVYVLSKTTRPSGDGEVPSVTHSFDAGAAWAYLALQASIEGWIAHGVGGIHRDRIRQELAVPDSFAIEAGIVIGRLADKSVLPEALQAREVASDRLPLAAIAAEGRFTF